jgi:hypothetical protein
MTVTMSASLPNHSCVKRQEYTDSTVGNKNVRDPFRGNSMPAVQFNRDSMARWYAEEHLKTDPGITSVYYLPENSGERQIRLIEVNHLMGSRNDDALEPIDFGVDTGTDTAHTLFLLDVTPEQWKRIELGQISLPPNWTLSGAKRFVS